MARFQWPKELRVLARDGIEADGVIIAFQPGTSSEGGRILQPVVRWVTAEGEERTASNGMASFSEDPRGRGDLLRILAAREDDGVVIALAEPEPAAELARALREGVSSANPLKWAGALKSPKVDWGRRVEGQVVALEEQPTGGSRVRVAFDGREEVLGPVVASPDPRQVGDVVDLGLAASGTVCRPPAGAASGAAELRAEMAREPSLLRKIWDSPFSP